uniref:Uncharacterized protein n=1 Tax=Podoviridae sp. ctsNK10 TaxID=2826582 RepID=A0A8S5NLQ6_9CAUD|nr:MAG TPA: hypothetical protein [Podoviridae sp. ctsNK10]
MVHRILKTRILLKSKYRSTKKIKERSTSGKSNKSHQTCLNMIVLESLKIS